MNTALLTAYADAKERLILAGYGAEIEWQAEIRFDQITPLDLWRETAFVILNSGMRATVIAKHWPAISAAFGNWQHLILPADCVTQALKVFGHTQKINAIATSAELIRAQPWHELRADIISRGVEALQQFPFIGPITAFHLAKNLGLNVAKPDRHLVRLAEAAGFADAHALCQAISEGTGDLVAVVDIVLWRYATLTPNYLDAFKRSESA